MFLSPPVRRPGGLFERCGMKFYPLILASAAIGAGLYSYHVASQQPQPQVIRGVLSRVTDGDTVQVTDADDARQRIRLEHVDAPEHNQPGKGDGEFWLSGFVGERVVVAVSRKDRYGRLVGVVSIEGSESLNKQLVSLGHAWWYNAYSKDVTYGLAELKARREGRGIWGDETEDVAPWEWRRKR